jgi:hypothetical protein
VNSRQAASSVNSGCNVTSETRERLDGTTGTVRSRSRIGGGAMLDETSTGRINHDRNITDDPGEGLRTTTDRI